MLLLLLELCLLVLGTTNALTTVRVGAFPEAEPMVVGFVEHYLDTTEYEVVLYRQTSGGRIIKKLTNNELDFSALGSAPFAAGASRGVPMTGIAVLHSKGSSQGLVIRTSSGISAPRDLLGKTVATVTASTGHFHMNFIVQQFQLDQTAFTLLLMSPGEAIAQWTDGTLDAVYCWGACQANALENGGTMMIPAAYLNNWGKETFNNVVVRNGFMQEHPAFVQKFVDVFLLLVNDYLKNSHEWIVGSHFLESIVEYLDPDFAKTDATRQALQLSKVKTFVQIGSDMQIVCQYLPAPDNPVCPVGGQIISTRLASEFSLSMKSLAVTGDDAYYANYMTSEYLLAFNTSLTMADMTALAHPVFTVGTENFCSGSVTLTDATGSFADGHGTNGGFADNSDCSWTISAGDATPVRLSFSLLSMERSFDWVRVYAGTGSDGVLLGQFTGRDLVVPELAAIGPVHVVYTTDSNRDHPFNYPLESGFTASYNTNAICATSADCGANGVCEGGSCTCDDGYFGGFCDSQMCLGTTFRTADIGVVSSGPASATQMPNDADCRWVITPAGGAAGDVVELVFTQFELDLTFDFVKVYDGDGVSATLLASFTGYDMPPAIRSSSPVITVQYTSDSLNASTGFQLEYSLQSSVCVDAADCSSHGACTDGTCVCDVGYYGTTCSSEYCLGSAATQTATSGSFRLQNAARTNYNNLLACDWQLQPEAHPTTGEAATGVLLFFSEWDVEASTGDLVEVWDVDTDTVLLALTTASSECSKDEDCGGDFGGGSCVRENEDDFRGVCVCNEGFVNMDCSMGSTAGQNASPDTLAGPLNVRVSFSSDFNNPAAYSGFALSYEGVYPCPTDSFGVECSGAGECRLAECLCAGGTEGVACQVNPAMCTSEHYLYTVGSCDSGSEKRSIQFSWIDPLVCETMELPPNVEIDCDMIPSASGTGGLVLALAIVGLLISLGFAAFVVVNGEKPVIKFAQKPFCLLFCFGASLCCLSLLAFVGENTDSSCLMRPWLFHLSLTIMFGSLFVKVWRVWRVFDNPAMKKIVIPNSTLYSILMRLIVADVVMLVVWSVWTPPELVEKVEFEPGVGNVIHYECDSENTNMTTVALVYKAGLILYGCFLAFKTRNVDGRFSEAKHIFLAIYNIALVGGLTLLLTQMMDVGASSGLTLQAIGTVWCAAVSLCAVFVPKMLMLDAVASTSMTGASGKSSQGTKGQTSMATSDEGEGAADFGIIQAQNDALQEELALLKQKLEQSLAGAGGGGTAGRTDNVTVVAAF